MAKNSPKKSIDQGRLSIVEDLAEQAKKNLSNLPILPDFNKDYSFLLKVWNDMQKNAEQLSKLLDLKQLGEKMTSAMREIADAEEKMKAFRENIIVAAPIDLIKDSLDFENRQSEERIIFSPRNEANTANLENKIVDSVKRFKKSLSKLTKAIDKNNESNKIIIVNDKSVYCKRCGHLLMRGKFVFIGDGTIRCPGCNETIYMPRDWTIKDLVKK